MHGGSGFEVDSALSCGLEDEERIKSIAQALCVALPPGFDEDRGRSRTSPVGSSE